MRREKTHRRQAGGRVCRCVPGRHRNDLSHHHLGYVTLTSLCQDRCCMVKHARVCHNTADLMMRIRSAFRAGLRS